MRRCAVILVVLACLGLVPACVMHVHIHDGGGVLGAGGGTAAGEPAPRKEASRTPVKEDEPDEDDGGFPAPDEGDEEGGGKA